MQIEVNGVKFEVAVSGSGVFSTQTASIGRVESTTLQGLRNALRGLKQELSLPAYENHSWSDERVVRVGDPPPYPDLATKKVHVVTPDRATVLENGTDGGKAAVALFAELPDGSVVMMQTTARIFEAIASVVRGACQSWGESV